LTTKGAKSTKFMIKKIRSLRGLRDLRGEHVFSSQGAATMNKGVEMKQDAKEAFKKTSLGAKNAAYDIIARLDPEYFEKLKGLYVDGTFGREGALPRKTKELIMIGITCALNRPRGVRLHCERALALGVSPREVLEAVEVAAIPGGMPGLWLGVETLQDILKVKGQEFK
jgi:4-carboxymuconolactone decarboxylase